MIDCEHLILVTCLHDVTQLVIVIDTRGKNSRSQIYIISYIDNKSIYGKLGRATLNIAKKRMTLLIAQHSISNDYSHFFFFFHLVYSIILAQKKKKNLASTRKLKVKRIYYESSKEIVT